MNIFCFFHLLFIISHPMFHYQLVPILTLYKLCISLSPPCLRSLCVYILSLDLH